MASSTNSNKTEGMAAKQATAAAAAAAAGEKKDAGESTSTTSRSGTKNKQPSSLDDSGAAAATSSSSSSSSNNKRSRTDEEPILDLAHTLSLRPGDKIEVQWQVILNDNDSSGEGGDNNDNKNNNSNVESRWWGATLLEHDGRTEDNVAIRTLDYDPYVEGGFPDRSQEDVIFVGPETLITYNPESSKPRGGSGDGNNDDDDDEEEEEEELEELTFRVVRDQKDNSVFINRDEANVMQVIDAAIMGAMQKNSKGWVGLTAAQQAAIADKVASKKQKLADLLMNHDKAVVTPADMQDILAKTMAEQDEK